MGCAPWVGVRLICYGATMFGPRPVRPPEPEPQESAPTAFIGESEEQRILRWRYQNLELAGFNEIQAEILARARHVDLHEAVALVEAGCTPLKAARILL